MLINDFNISTINCEQMNVDIKSASLSNESEWIKNAILPIWINNNITFKELNILIGVSGINNDEVTCNTSNLISKFLTKVTLTLENYFHKYICILKGNASKKINEQYTEVTLNLIGIEIGEEITVTLDKITSKSIVNSGNINTPVKLKITPYSAMSTIEVEGLTDTPIQFNNITSGVIIKFDYDVQPCISDSGKVILYEYPYLKSGSNLITVDNINCKIEITYYPRFV